MSLRFTSNGSRTVVIDIPRDAIIKEALLELEARELPDSTVIRVGLLKNCSLEDFNMLEERLERTPWGKNTVRPGWGATEGTSFLVDETGRYRVIPIDPSTMIGAHPHFYRREFDAVIIPNGPLHADLTNLLNSGLPVITMNPMIARKLGLCSDESLHAAITNLHIRDTQHYISEQCRDENIRIGGGGRGQAGQVLVDAVEPSPEYARGVIDTGITSQSVLVTGMENKYAYIAFSRIDQLLGDDRLFSLFRRTMEWCSIGGYLTNLGIDVCGLPGGFKKLGRFSEMVDTPDFSEKITEHMDSGRPNEEGNFPITLTFHSDSPGILILGNLRIRGVFPTLITTFAGGDGEVKLDFDSVDTVRSVMVEIPCQADIKEATVKVEGGLTRERVGIISANEQDVYGVTSSGRYSVGQRFSPERLMTVSRIGLHLADPEGNAEVDVEIREDHRSVPGDVVTGISSLRSGDIGTQYEWIDVRFDDPVLRPDVKYWIILRTRSGQILWHADRKCPHGGLLSFTKDGGKNWQSHDMDALFKVYYLMETYDGSPSLSLTPGADMIWTHSREFRDVHTIPDFSQYLGDYLKEHPREVGMSEIVQVPLFLSALSIGTLRLFDLRIICELPTRELREKVEPVSIGKQLESVLELISNVRTKVAALLEVLPEDVRENLEMRE